MNTYTMILVLIGAVTVSVGAVWLFDKLDNWR